LQDLSSVEILRVLEHQKEVNVTDRDAQKLSEAA
jgi:hypothetical protein